MTISSCALVVVNLDFLHLSLVVEQSYDLNSDWLRQRTYDSDHDLHLSSSEYLGKDNVDS